MEPALAPLTVPQHVEAPARPGPASLAMAVAALEPHRDVGRLHTGFDRRDTTTPGELALAALRRGFHAVLHGSTDPGGVADARQAGLVHRARAPGVREATGALEAGHPTLALVDRHQMREASPPGPTWVCLVDADDETVRYHDPIDEGGPSTIGWDALARVLGHHGERLLLEIGPATREDR